MRHQLWQKVFHIKLWTSLFWFVNSSILLYLLTPLSATAQIVPDATLPINSNVGIRGNTNIINGGTRTGNNLFHSFQQFSIPTNGVAYFNNASDIQNIISRVTGSSISNIDGLIRANGTANLILINPKGISFGSNASINIGGSFLGSTASSVNFADGTKFSTKAPQNTPLLTISIPIGLEFGSSPGGIRVEGTGNGLENPIYLPFPKDIGGGLRVQPGKTLALVGGDINLDGGILTAPEGQVELGSVDSSSLVRLSPKTSGWILDYQGVPSFKDIQLSRQALVNASGEEGGDIHLSGRRITLTGGSVALVQNQGSQRGGSISVNASDYLEESGTSPDGRVPSNIVSENLGVGSGGEIAVATKRLTITDGARIASENFSTAKGSNITVTAPDSLQLIGFSPISSSVISAIVAASHSSGDTGDVTVSTGQLTALNGGYVESTTFGTGAGGNVTVDGTDFIKLIGVNPNNFAPSLVGATTAKTGNAGNVEINTANLVVRDGGRIESSTAASGNAGSVTINASNSVEVSGIVLGAVNPSLVASSAIIENKVAQQILGLPPVPSGEPGNVTINTGRLSITNSGLVSVRNQGTGTKAGDLRINARSIFLDNKGGITAATASGEGGNLFLNAQNLQLDQNSSITASAGGSGNGGNITISTQVLPLLDSSAIRADAQGGTGGRVTINTQGLFLSPDSSITATSQLGPQFNGIVQINIPTQLNFARASSTPTPPPQSPQVTAVCPTGAGSQNSLINSGTGGIPPTVDSASDNNAVWQGNSTLVHKSRAAKSKKHSFKRYLPVPATGIAVYPDGTFAFVATSTPVGFSSGCPEANIGR